MNDQIKDWNGLFERVLSKLTFKTAFFVCVDVAQSSSISNLRLKPVNGKALQMGVVAAQTVKLQSCSRRLQYQIQIYIQLL